jgi:hypothetical protein
VLAVHEPGTTRHTVGLEERFLAFCEKLMGFRDAEVKRPHRRVYLWRLIEWRAAAPHRGDDGRTGARETIAGAVSGRATRFKDADLQ